jgi:hypothetical protein
MTTLALLGATAPHARAGDREWAVAGKVMAGVGAGLLLSQALTPAPVYAAIPVYVAPAPVVVQQPAQIVVQQPFQTVTTVYQPVVIQQPVVVQSAPVIYQPAPVVYPAPVYVRPVCAPPVIRVGFSLGHGHRHHHRHGRH